jgi:hypothetical protein
MSKLDACNKMSTKLKVDAVLTKAFLCVFSGIVRRLYGLDTEELGKRAVFVRVL